MDRTASTRREESPPQPLVALLGRRDEPTDALRDYCAGLARALGKRGVGLRFAEMAWEKSGWLRAFWWLWKQSADWRGGWVLVQYTALMWSRHGFPLAVPLVLAMLRLRGANVAVIFHDVIAYPGRSWINRTRIRLQLWIMRQAYWLADRAIVTIPMGCIPWLPDGATKAEFIPVGANIPAWKELTRDRWRLVAPGFPTVAVFGMSSLPAVREREIEAIVQAIRQVLHRFPRMRLLAMGRGTAEAEPLLRQRLKEVEVELDVKGLLPGEEVSRLLASSDVMLFVRGPLSSRRGSALAGVACGLPVVGYHGPETGFPLTEAGVLLAPYEDQVTLAKNLMEVLEDEKLRQRLRARSIEAYRQWFAWHRIADQLLEALGVPSWGGVAETLEAAAMETHAGAPPTKSIRAEASPQGRKAAIKVLICSHYFYPVPGGAQEYTRLLAEGLVQAGQKVVVTTETGRDGWDDGQYRFALVRQPGLARLWRLIGKADVVHVTGPAFGPLLLALCRRKGTIVKQHGYQVVCPNGLLFYEPMKMVCPGHFMARRFHKCLRCNAASEGWLKSLRMLLGTFPHRWLSKRAVNVPVTFYVEQRLGLPRCKVIYHGIPEPPAPALQRTTLGEPSSPACFAYVGRLVNEKGLPLLMEAVARLKGSGRDLTVKFVGEGPERERLEELAKRMGLRDLAVFTGFLSGNALEEALKDVTALVMPTIMEETAGLAAIEQMMRRRLVIVSDIGGLTELVGTAGLKFPPGDTDGLVRCMELAMDQPEQRNELARQARERALQLFRQEKMVENYLELYGRLADGRA